MENKEIQDNEISYFKNFLQNLKLAEECKKSQECETSIPISKSDYDCGLVPVQEIIDKDLLNKFQIVTKETNNNNGKKSSEMSENYESDSISLTSELSITEDDEINYSTPPSVADCTFNLCESENIRENLRYLSSCFLESKSNVSKDNKSFENSDKFVSCFNSLIEKDEEISNLKCNCIMGDKNSSELKFQEGNAAKLNNSKNAESVCEENKNENFKYIDVRLILRKMQNEKILKLNDLNFKDEKQHEGILFYQKLIPNRISVYEYINLHCFNSNYVTVNNESFKLSFWNKICQVDFSNAYKFTFSNATSDIMIVTHDRALIIPNDNNEIGFNEIKMTFLTMSGVNPKRISIEWIKHHYHMIILKLAWIEKELLKCFTQQICNPQNVIAQLKYRYDREISREHKSCLKRILQGLDDPSKLMVLVVLNITKNPSNYDGIELVLSDKWYYIKAIGDLAIERIIDHDIRIGTKLFVQNSELINFTKNCNDDPLKLISLTNIRLKIHTNSIQSSPPNLKLGFYNNNTWIDKRLHYLFKDGGKVTSLTFFVARVYPIIIVHKFENDIHSVASRIHSHDSHITDYSEENYQHKSQAFVGGQSKNIHMNSPTITAHKTLQLRVVDLKQPNSSAIFSIYNPNDNHFNNLKENCVVKIQNFLFEGQKNGEIYLSNLNKTKYKTLSFNLDNSNLTYLSRHLIEIEIISSSDFKNIVFNEVDTYGLIVEIEYNPILKLQSVYLADYKENIICINFSKSIQESVCEDIIKVENFLLARNLRLYSNKICSSLPNLFATNASVFSKISIRNKEDMEKFFDSFKYVNIKELLKQCVIKIKKLKEIRKFTNISL